MDTTCNNPLGIKWGFRIVSDTTIFELLCAVSYYKIEVRKLIFLIIVIITSSCNNRSSDSCNYITDYYPLVNKADLAFTLGDYQEAYTLFEKAFSLCKPKNTSNYYELTNFAEAAAILNHYDKTYESAVIMILQGRELSSFKKNRNYEDFFKSKYAELLIDKYDALHRQYIENINTELRDDIKSMRIRDQMFRGRNNDKSHSKLDSVDTLNELLLIEIFENHGYPSDEMVGPNSSQNRIDLTLILLHTSDSIRMNYFVPKLRQFIKEGSASPYTLGSIIDQYYIYNGQAQIYGTYKERNGDYTNMIDDLNKIDSNRTSIGLPTLRIKEIKDSLWLEKALSPGRD